METNKAKFKNSDVISAINQLASAIHSVDSCTNNNYCVDGTPVSEDLDSLLGILFNQIVCCVPREKQHAILIAHGLEEYIEELDECWNNYRNLALKDGCDIEH